jgi:cold shock CspA family protein
MSREFGVVVHWNHSGGYGFARGDVFGEHDIFMHVSALNGEEPRIGDKVSYEVGTDSAGRRCAANVRYVTSDDDAQDDVQEEAQEEREQLTADYAREEQTALADALRRAGDQARQ